jgi:hypothetical protein
MPRNPSAHVRRFSATKTAAIFWNSGEVWQREADDLARYGAPPALRKLSVPVRADFIVLEQNGFVLERDSPKKGEGVRAFLFLLTDEDGEALNIIAWVPQLNRFSTWIGHDPADDEDEAGNSASIMREHCDQEAA